MLRIKLVNIHTILSYHNHIQNEYSVCVGIIAAIAIDWHRKDRSGIMVPWEGVLGGLVNTIALSLAPQTFKYAGLGIGFVVWIGVSMLIGWSIGRYGFSQYIHPVPAQYPAIDYFGVTLCLIALIIMLFVKPSSNISIYFLHEILYKY